MQAALTSRQRQILSFIENRQRETGLVPTVQETATHFGFRSSNSVRQHLRLIEKKGFIHRLRGRSRALVLSRHDEVVSESVRVPLLGRIRAGVPGCAEQHVEETLDVPAHFFHGISLFALHVHGSSMQGAGILDGDIAILDSRTDCSNGVIAAVLIDEDATLKRVYHMRGQLLLRPENPEFADITVSSKQAKHIRILGVLVGVMRKI